MDTYFGTVYMEADVPHTFSCGLTLGIQLIAYIYKAESLFNPKYSAEILEQSLGLGTEKE